MGQTSWNVVVTPHMEDFGLVEFNAATILLNENQTGDMIRDSLVHEILHVLLWSYGIDLGSPEQEEAVVKTLAPVLLEVLCNNSELLSVLVGDMTLEGVPTNLGAISSKLVGG